MNTPMSTPAYLVQVRYPVEPNRNKSYTFRNAILLSARESAFQKKEQIFVAKQSHEVIDVIVDLVEIDRSSTSNKHLLIATVFRQRLHRTMFMSEGKDLLKSMQLDALTTKSLPPSLFLTLNLENEAGNSIEIVAKPLAEVADELAYYQYHGYSTIPTKYSPDFQPGQYLTLTSDSSHASAKK